jgi:broad specificity phosphatase PhoE
MLMRHGQASFGETRYDSLSTLGRQQALATGRWLRERDETVTSVRHGPRARQAETAALVIEASGLALSPQPVTGLDEFAEGEDVLAAAAVLFGRPMVGPEAPSRTEQLRCYDAAYEAWSQGTLDIPGRAGFIEFRYQVAQWLRESVAAPDAPGGQRILAITSAGVIAGAVCEVLGLPDEQWCPFVRLIRNGSLTEIVFSKGRTGLRSFNSAGHLPPRSETSI